MPNASRPSNHALSIASIVLYISTLFVLVSPVSIAHATDGFLYAVTNDPSGNTINAFSVNELTGTLTPLSGFPVATGGASPAVNHSGTLTIDTVNRRLYVINDTSDTLSAFSIDPATGKLSALPFGPIALGTGTWRTVAVHPGGSPVIVGDEAVGQLASFNITSTTATAASGSPFVVGLSAAPFLAVFSRDGNTVYTGGGSGNAIAGLSVDPSTGVLTPLVGSPFDTGAANPRAITTDLAGRLYLGNFSAGQVSVFTTVGGIPAAVTNSPFATTLSGMVQGIVHPKGFFFVVDRSGNSVGSFRVTDSGSSTTLQAGAGSPYATGGINPNLGVLNQSGTFLYVANGVSRNITTFSVNDATGVLSAAAGQTAGTLGSSGVTTGLAYLPPTSSYLYALVDSFDAVSKVFGFSVNENTGSLMPLNGFPIISGSAAFVPEGGSFLTGVQRIAVDARNSRLYVVDDGGDNLYTFAISPATGALTVLYPPISLGLGNWNCVSVHPSGAPVLVGDFDGSALSFNISPFGLSLASGSPYSLGTARPLEILFSRDGKFAYFGGGSNSLAAFGVNSATGVLSPLSGSPFTTAGTFLANAIDASGALFFSDSNTGQKYVFTTVNGTPVQTLNSPFTSTNQSSAYGFVAPGGFYITGDQVTSAIDVSRISGSGTLKTLASVSGSPFILDGGDGIFAQNFSGSMFFAARNYNRSISTIAVNQLTGALTLVGKLPDNALPNAGILSSFVYVPPPVEVSVAISGTTSVVAGSGDGNVSYTVTVANSGQVAATGLAVSLISILPQGVSLVSTEPSTGSVNTTNSLWTVGTLASGASATLAITMTAGASAGTSSISTTVGFIGFEQARIRTSGDSASISTAVSVAPTPTPTSTSAATPTVIRAPCFGGDLPAPTVKITASTATVTLPTGKVASAECMVTARVTRAKPKFAKSKKYGIGKRVVTLSKLKKGSFSFFYEVLSVATANVQTSRSKKGRVK